MALLILLSLYACSCHTRRHRKLDLSIYLFATPAMSLGGVRNRISQLNKQYSIWSANWHPLTIIHRRIRSKGNTLYLCS